MRDNKPIKVLHIAPGNPYGGIQTLLPQLAAAQLRRGLDVHVLSIYDNKQFSADLNARGIPFSTTQNRRPSLGGAIEFARTFSSFSPDLVHLHAHLLWSDLLALALKRKACPWICHVHSYPSGVRSTKDRILQAAKTRLCGAYITVSESVAGVMRDSMAHRSNEQQKAVFAVHNGIELPTFVPNLLDHDKTIPLYGMATRMVDGKGVWEFVAVAEQIAVLQPRARFVIAGDGPLKNNIQAYLKANGLASCFSLPGHVVDMTAFWRSLDVAIFTSPDEAFGLRIIEPMAHGVPVVAYQTGYGSDELVINGETALCASWNDASELARHAIRLVTDPDLRSRIIESARADVRERFSIDAMCSGVKSVYDAVLDC